MGNTTINTCKDCGEKLIGRSDKKYCNDYCRNNFNNKQNAFRFEHIKYVNRILKSNWRILQSLYKEGNLKSSEDILLSMGFKFECITGIEVYNGKVELIKCYNYSLVKKEGNQYALKLNEGRTGH